MKKLLIPTVLAATILVAGIFTFIPVQKASTVHGAIQTNVGQVFKDEATNLSAMPGDDSAVTIDRNVQGVDGKRFKACIAGNVTDDVDGDTRGPQISIHVNDGDDYGSMQMNTLTDDATRSITIVTTRNNCIEFSGIDPAGPDPTYKIVLDEVDATTSIADLDFVVFIEIVG